MCVCADDNTGVVTSPGLCFVFEALEVTLAPSACRAKLREQRRQVEYVIPADVLQEVVCPLRMPPELRHSLLVGNDLGVYNGG